MKMLFVMLLIFSCGKEPEKSQKKRSDVFIVKTPAQREKPIQKIDFDSDGDLIPDQKDPRHLVADIPEAKLKLDVWDDGRQIKVRTVPNKSIEQAIFKFLIDHHRKKLMKMKRVTEPLNFLRFDPLSSNLINLELSNNEHKKNLKVFLKNFHTSLIEFDLPHQETKWRQLSKELLQNKGLHFNVNDFKTDRGTKSQILSHVKAKTVEVLFFNHSGSKRYYVSTKSSLRDSLSQISHFDLTEFETSQNIFLRNDLELLPDDQTLYFLINAQDLEVKPIAGEQIILVKTNLGKLRSYQKEKRFISTKLSHKITNLQVSANEGVNISGKAQSKYPIQKVSHKGCYISLGALGKLKVYYQDYSIKWETREGHYEDFYQTKITKQDINFVPKVETYKLKMGKRKTKKKARISGKCNKKLLKEIEKGSKSVERSSHPSGKVTIETYHPLH